MKTSVKGFMFYVAFVASLGGLLFGFDTAVISGAEKAIQGIYALSDFAHGFTIATALIGTIVGALVCGGPAERYGRLRSLKVIAWLYLISAVGSAVIVNWYSFMFFRFLGGLAVGASSVVGPMYIAEISPSHWRGRFVAFFQFNIVLGIVIAYLTNYWIVGIPHDWQWMLGIEAVPALAFGLLLMTVPESPRWLLIRSRDAEARRVLERTTRENVEAEMAEIRASLAGAGDTGERLFRKKYFIPILLAFLISTFNQLTGINAILDYAPRLFEMSGVFREGGDDAQSIMIGITNLNVHHAGHVPHRQGGAEEAHRRRCRGDVRLAGARGARVLARTLRRLLHACLPDGLHRLLRRVAGRYDLGGHFRGLPQFGACQGAGAGQHDPLGCGRRCCRGSSLSSFRLAAPISSDFSRLLPSAALSLR